MLNDELTGLRPVARLVFCWLRKRSGSVLAPTITHAALNSLAVLGGLVVARWLQG